MSFVLGETTLGATSAAFSANQTFLNMYIVPQDCTLDSFSWISRSTDGTRKWRAVCYSSTLTGSPAVTPRPSTLLGKSNDVTGVTANTTHNVAFQSSISLTKGQVIWLGIMVDGSTNCFVATNHGYNVFWTRTFSSGPDTTAPSTSNSANCVSMWGLCTASSANDKAVGNVNHYERTSISSGGGANHKLVQKITLTETDNITSLYVFINDTTVSTGINSGKIKAVIYSDIGGNPAGLVAVGTEVAPAPGGWFALPITATALAAGDYWIGYIADTNFIHSYGGATGIIKFNSNTYTSGPTDPFGTPTTTNNVAYDLFAAVTINTSPPPPPPARRRGAIFMLAT